MFGELLYDSPEMEIEQRSEFLGIIIKESERLTRLINTILDLAKMEAGRFEWQMSDSDPKAIIDEALAATASLFHKHPPVQLSTDIPAELPTVHVDADRLTQVVVNLIANAVKFCDQDDGKVGVDADVKDGWLLVAIADNGKGVANDRPEQDLRQISAGPRRHRQRSPGHGSGTADLATDHRAFRREDLGRRQWRARLSVYLFAAHRGRTCRCAMNPFRNLRSHHSLRNFPFTEFPNLHHENFLLKTICCYLRHGLSPKTCCGAQFLLANPTRLLKLSFVAAQHSQRCAGCSSGGLNKQGKNGS